MASETKVSASLATERRYLTSIFIDLVGYTPLSEELDPEDLRLLQRRYQNLALTVMERFGGFVAQFQGDGVVVYFGYPLAHENDAERAVRASLEFLHRLQNLDTSIRDGSDFPLTARIGIHCGLALIGSELLSGGVAEFSAIGEAVNLAARLQGEAPPGSVVVSRETAQLVEGRFTFEDLGSADHQRPVSSGRHLQGYRAGTGGHSPRDGVGLRRSTHRRTPAEHRAHSQSMEDRARRKPLPDGRCRRRRRHRQDAPRAGALRPTGTCGNHHSSGELSRAVLEHTALSTCQLPVGAHWPHP